MKLTVFNGSGRGVKSNTTLLMKPFMQGFESVSGGDVHMSYLSPHPEKQPVQEFTKADFVVLAFPLYVDSMPGMVKDFIEQLQPHCGREGNPTLGFVIHCGFPEALHLRYLERYLEKLARRLGCPYAGCVVRGGTEGIQIMPEKMTRSLFIQMYNLGASLATQGVMEPALIKKAAGRERYPAGTGIILAVLSKMGVINGYWDESLKKNNVFSDRYARPYADE